MARSGRAEFLATLGFDLDDFQLRGIDALDEGHNVVVAAPTGSGKTVVAEYAAARALAEGGKVFYTTPLKALSNQKFTDFGRRYGLGRVGLLTGDNSLNPGADLVVMTTEVLRNMVYAGSATLAGLRYVVLDEVHYLQDPYRGPVWEEVIIHLPAEVDLVCLSATVSNAEELADWVATVRGSTRAVIEERRPVPLHNLFLAGERRSGHLLLLPTFVEGRPNAQGAALTSGVQERWRGQRRGGLFPPARSETVELLGERGLLPAIYFIFSRAGCDEGVRQCLREVGRLTSPAQRRRARDVAEESTRHLSDQDLAALGYGEWLSGLEAGVAAHHAGMVPPFKEAVERCFSEGLVQVVFATETLSLGINMPARSVVIEKLVKFGGDRSQPLTPGEYTQLTGRAGRRGTDEEGYAVVAWSPGVTFEQVASLAGARSYTLVSSFRPTYNMATNLVRRCTPEQAHHLLNLSFAQYRADADVVRLESHLERARSELEAARRQAHCERGDVWEYLHLVEMEAAPGREHRARATSADIAGALAGLRPGDVVVVPARKGSGAAKGTRVAVLSTSQRRNGDLSVKAITAERRLVSLAPRDFRAPPRALARVALPGPFAPRSRDFQRQVASSLARSQPQALAGRPPPAGTGHPVADCPDARAHLRWAARGQRLARQVERLERQVRGRTESLARQFDRVLQLLEHWGYVKGWALTEPGRRLARIYHEQDLLLAECAERGLFEDLGTAEVAALASVFSYEPRGPVAPVPVAQLPGPRLGQRWREVLAVSAELARAEESGGLPGTRPPDAGFAAAAYGWARGQDLARALAAGEGRTDGRGASMAPGDFVRNIKQLIDLLRQLSEVLPTSGPGTTARRAADALFRGVVAASSVVGNGDTDEPAEGVAGELPARSS